MSLIFLAPLFLAGLAAIAVPVIIHLTHKERKEPIAFPSLMFLERIPYRTDRRQRIRHWLLFLLRAAAIMLLVAAFARPLLEGGPVGAVRAASARDVVILLDRSASMQQGDRWDRAVRAAGAAVAEAGIDDRITLVAFADRPDVAVSAATDRAMLTAALGHLRPGDGTTAYPPALRLAGELLEDAEREREVVLITDFQRSGWRAGDISRLPAGTAFRHVDVGGDDMANRGVAGVIAARSRAGTQERVTVSARIVGGGDAGEFPVELAIDGQVAQTVRVRVPADGDAVATFAPLQDPERPTRATVRLPGDEFPADDRWHVVLRPAPRVGVLLVRHAAAARRDQLYVLRALDVAHDPAFPVVERQASQVQAADLDDAAVVVLLGVPFPGGSPGRRLLQFVADGGGLFMTLGPRDAALPQALADSLGTPAVGTTDRVGDAGATAGITDYQHPVFAAFRGAATGDLATARVFRYRALEPPAGTVLARYDDGAVALVETAWGRGRILVWTSDLSNRWNDLPLRAAFVPFLQNAIRHLGRYVAAPLAHSTGAVAAVADIPDAAGTRLVLERPDGSRLEMTGDTAHIRLDQAGFHVLRPAADRTRPLALLAANTDPAESTLDRVDPDEVAAAAQPLTGTAPAATAAAGLTPGEKERRQGLWWYFLVAVFVLLAVESVVAYRARRAA